MKFGGTAIDSPEKLIHVANLIKFHCQKKDNQIMVVVSAIRGITDGILFLANSISRGDKLSIRDFVDNIKKIHNTVLDKAINDKELRNKAHMIHSKLIDELEHILDGIVLLSEITPKSLDYLLSFGERLSTPLVSFALRDIGLNAQYMTGKEAGILTDSSFGAANPLIDTTKLRVLNKIEPLLNERKVPVITGFIGADQNGNITTLGRGGSDYTATIVAASTNADEVWLWSDVDGLLTADPKIVKNARVLREISFAEAMEMALFGAKYMHPRALEPVIMNKIPLRIRNTFNVKDRGTLILEDPRKVSQRIVKSISAIRHTALIDVAGVSMVGAPGTAAKIFDSLARSRINIMMISQSPSESSISMIVRKNDLDRAVTTIELNLLGTVIKQINVNEDVAVIAAVGSGMRGIKGVAAKVFGAVAKRNINVIMIAQGSSELNLAFAVNDRDCREAVNILHNEFKLYQS